MINKKPAIGMEADTGLVDKACRRMSVQPGPPVGGNAINCLNHDLSDSMVVRILFYKTTKGTEDFAQRTTKFTCRFVVKLENECQGSIGIIRFPLSSL